MSPQRSFEVWAPKAQSVALILGNERVEMKSVAGGWFEIEADAVHGDDYAFSLDGSDPLPDPRSGWQPYGPGGSSRVVDHDVYKWATPHFDPGPLKDQVIYEIHIGTFTEEGTFDAAIERFPHLESLGVTAIELMPVAEFPGERGWGYDGVDLFAPHHAYGGPDGLKRLVDAAHTMGIAVIVDVVYNHLGPSGNYLGRFGHYFTDRYATPWGDAINFDGPESGPVREFFVENALTWLRDYHLDGLRLDAIHAILDTSALHILEEIAEFVRPISSQDIRAIWVIAESDLNDPRIVQSRDHGGYGLDAQWSDDFHHSLFSLLTGDRSGYYADFGKVAHLAKAYKHAFVYGRSYSEYRRRFHGRAFEDIPGHRFLGYLQNHDQVGNRATGDRSSGLMSPGLLKIGAALVLTSPFVPMLFMGEEWGASTPFLYFTDHHDPALGRAVTEGRKREFAAFGWDPSDVPDPQGADTFRRSKLVWNESSESPHSEFLEWHKQLIALRKAHPELREGDLDGLKVSFDEEERWIVVERGSFTIAANLSADERFVPTPQGGEVILASDDSEATGGAIRLLPQSIAIRRG
ncbi:MAG: maltooligosyltrehalose trehalohydrolase [Actinomycetota bacterium]|nr:maltooligosyltrehalose trehalohydrolase [Actinomycetota bacterium]